MTLSNPEIKLSLKLKIAPILLFFHSNRRHPSGSKTGNAIVDAMQVSHQAEGLAAAGRICDPSPTDPLSQTRVKGVVIVEKQTTSQFDTHFCIVNVCYSLFVSSSTFSLSS